MYRTVRTLVLLLVVALGFGMLYAPSLVLAMPAESDPQPICLQLSDMPTGFAQTLAETLYESNEVIAARASDPARELAWLNSIGRVNGFSTVYRKSGLAAYIGVAAAWCSVGVYQDAAGAQERFIANTKPVPGLDPISMEPIGESSSARTSTRVMSNDVVIRYFVIAFRKANVNVSVTTAGTSGTMSFDDALALARIVEGRIW